MAILRVLFALTIGEILHRFNRADEINDAWSQLSSRFSDPFVRRKKHKKTNKLQSGEDSGEGSRGGPLVEANHPQPRFDVFLCFHKEDPCLQFTTHLYRALEKQGVHTFIGEEELQGDEITEQQPYEMERYSIAIPIFTSSFPESKWCLTKVASIMSCEKLTVLPIFYNIDPSEVRYLKGSFLEAFRNHEQLHGEEVTQGWRQACRHAAMKAGFNFTDAYINGNDKKLVEMVVETVRSELRQSNERIPLPNSDLDGKTAVAYRDKLKALLLEPDVHKIGVWGMGGVGKTSIVSNLCNELLNSSENPFEKIIYVKVPFEDSVRVVRNEIGGQLMIHNLEDEAGGNGVRAAALLRGRLGGKKYLLILDDLWRTIDLEEVGVPEPNRASGCKIVLTTRNRGVCHSFRTQSDLKIEPMLHEEAMEFFLEKVGNVPKDIEPFSDSVVEECGGLPLGLLAVADFLRNQSERITWARALASLRNSTPLNKEMERALEQLRLSYHRLENQMLKDMFLACVFYVGQSGISRFELRKYLVLEGILGITIDTTSLYSCLRGELNQVIKLRDACMLEYSQDNDQVHVVGFMRMMVHNMLQPNKFIIRHNEDLLDIPSEEWKSAERISLKGSSIHLQVPRKGRMQELVSLMLNDCKPLVHIPEAFFYQMGALRILNLSHTSLRRLPISLRVLTKLRLLDLSDCDSLKTIRGVGGLKNLLFLSLRGCSRLRQLPYNEISRLTKLRVFNLNETSSLRTIPHGIFSKLSSLEMLTMVNSGYVWSTASRWRFPLRVSACLQELIGLQALEILCLIVENYSDFESLKKATGGENSSLKRIECMILRSVTYEEFNRDAINEWSTSSP